LSSVGLAIFGITLSPIIVPAFFPQYNEAIQVIQIVSLSIIPTTINLMFTSKFLAAEKNRIILISSGIHLSVLVTSLILLGRMYGINGMAAALVLAISTESVYYYIINRHEKSFQNFSTN